MHAHILFALALALGLFALFVLWVWTGLFGALAAAAVTHVLLRFCETRSDRAAALARKARAESLLDAFCRTPRR